MDILEVLLTSLLSVAALFITAKLMGHKQLSQMDFFDYISGITIGSIAAELATELEEPIAPLIALAVYGVASVVLGIITHKLPRTRKYINGSPTILMQGGKLYRENMKKAKLDLSEFLLLCREQGYFDLAEIEVAVFEHNGKLSVLPKSAHRPVTPDDLSLSPGAASMFVEVIMDGRILGENLTRMGVDTVWLEKKLREAGCKSAKDVFLGVCGKDGELKLFLTDG